MLDHVDDRTVQDPSSQSGERVTAVRYAPGPLVDRALPLRDCAYLHAVTPLTEGTVPTPTVMVATSVAGRASLGALPDRGVPKATHSRCSSVLLRPLVVVEGSSCGPPPSVPSYETSLGWAVELAYA